MGVPADEEQAGIAGRVGATQQAQPHRRGARFLARYRQLGGFQFRRQAPIGPYIVDFVCFERRLVIEVDGGQHEQAEESDRKRSDWLERNGFRVLRFWNHHVLQAPDSVVEAVWQAIGRPAPTSLPSAGRP